MKGRMEREITKEIYDRALNNRGYIDPEDRPEVFDRVELCGYGVYGPKVFEKDDKYFVAFNLGSSCD